MPNKDKNWQAFQTGLPALPKHLFENQQPPRQQGRTLSQIFLAMKAATTQADHSTETHDEAANEIANWRNNPHQPRGTGASPVTMAHRKQKQGCGCGPSPKPESSARTGPGFLTDDQKAQIRRRIDELRGKRPY